MRINKLFSNYGICSRKEANRFIEEGRVIVNGKVAIKGQWVEEEDEILIDNVKIKEKEKVYIAFNKPVGVTCTAAKEVKDNIIDFIDYNEYIFPVGRLDKLSEGLIIMTNDGDLGNKILEAENGHEKEYIVTLDRPFDEEFLENMSKGVKISNDVVTKPCKIKRINNETFNIVLTQGLNRQIRKMSKVLGYNVTKLKRIRIMNIYLKDLEIGKSRNLTEDEIIFLKES